MKQNFVGTKIRARREGLGMKQAALAKKSGISSSYLNLIEHNKRGIGGKVLHRIAGALGLEITDLSESGDSALARALRLAAREAASPAEEARLEEFVTRFPGWAQALADLRQRATQLERIVDTLSDRLAHDPFLSESLHEMLSSVTAIHATSGILAQAKTMEPLQLRRFQNNIFDESGRLSELSQGLVQYFDHLAEGEHHLSTPLDELVAYLATATDAIPAGSPTEGARNTPGGHSRAAGLMIEAALTRLCADAELLPQETLNAALSEENLDPLAIASAANVSPDVVLRSLAFRAAASRDKAFGLIECDGTGAITLRKDLAGFALPRYGAGCALWPLYSAMTRPHVMEHCDLELPSGQLFEAFALASFSTTGTSTLPPVLRAVMIFRPKHGRADARARPVGANCRICPRDTCQARREPSIHD